MYEVCFFIQLTATRAMSSTSTALQVQSYKYSTTSTVLQVQPYKYSPTSTVKSSNYLASNPAIRRVVWAAKLHARGFRHISELP